jgi:hypothetical protein
MPKLKDDGFSPFVAPTKKGTHPHTLNGNYERDPKDQDGYEFVDEVEPRVSTRRRPVGSTSGGGGAGRSWPAPSNNNNQLPQSPEAQKGIVEWLFEHPLISLAGLAAGYIALTGNKRKKNPEGEEDIVEEGMIEDLPPLESGVAGQNLTINVNCPPGVVAATTLTPGTAASPDVEKGTPPLPSTQKVVSPPGTLIPVAIVSEKEKQTVVVDEPKVVVEEKPKKHVRVTTQKQDPKTGKFLPAGTAKLHVQGASGAAAQAVLKKAKKERKKKK